MREIPAAPSLEGSCLWVCITGIVSTTAYTLTAVSYHRFRRRFGSSKCRDIIGVRFKEGYDIRRFFLKGMRCLTVVYTSIASVFD